MPGAEPTHVIYSAQWMNMNDLSSHHHLPLYNWSLPFHLCSESLPASGVKNTWNSDPVTFLHQVKNTGVSSVFGIFDTKSPGRSSVFPEMAFSYWKELAQ